MRKTHGHCLNLLSANFTKWSNTLKQFVGNLPTNCLSVFDHFVGLAVKGLTFPVFSNKVDAHQCLYMGCYPYSNCHAERGIM